MNTFEKVKETNRIEGITREPTQAEANAFEYFLALEEVTIHELEKFTKIYQPDAKLRSLPGLDVRIGKHVPPKGGAHIAEQLQALLIDANATQGSNEAWKIHLQYENLHPFTDGNGRSGRMLWYWMMWPNGGLGFLHTFYYQTLSNQ